MKRRLLALAGLALAIGAEMLIGRYGRGFVRDYLGDVLAVVCLCLLARALWPEGKPWLPLAVFGVAVAVECAQGLGLSGLPVIRDSRLLRVALGSRFDPTDIACYAVGCAAVWAFERMGRS